MPHRPLPVTLSFPVLVGDIGGTNARFGLIETPDAEMTIFPTARTADFDDPAEAYTGRATPVESAVIAVSAVFVSPIGWLLLAPLGVATMFAAKALF
eukprot:gene23959-25576_t